MLSLTRNQWIAVVVVFAVAVIGTALVMGGSDNGAVATNSPTAQPSAKAVPSTVTVRINQPTGAIAGASVSVEAIVEDSRCPKGVVCVQAGTVRIRATVVTTTGSYSPTLTLGAPYVKDGTSVTLTAVSPAPSSTYHPLPSEYRFTFHIVRAR